MEHLISTPTGPGQTCVGETGAAHGRTIAGVGVGIQYQVSNAGSTARS